MGKLTILKQKLRKQKIEIQTAESGEQIFSNAETLQTEISYQRSTLPKQKLGNRNIIER